MFNTPDADRILAALQVFPPDNPWNEDISKRPVLKNSSEIIATIGPGKSLAYNLDMAFILVPANQKRVDAKILDYPDESDKGPYPIPDEAPIEGWPLDGRTLAAAQAGKEQGDRHVIVVDPINRMLYEFWQARKTAAGWQFSNEATFDLKTNKTRPDGWTSSDAAGLPIFPAVIRFDEVERGTVDHAMRFTVRNTRRAYVYPATHFASRETAPNLPRMGERFRLRAGFDLAGFSPHAQAILNGLKKYGMFVADNGGDWRISVAPDRRVPGPGRSAKSEGVGLRGRRADGAERRVAGEVTLTAERAVWPQRAANLSALNAFADQASRRKRRLEVVSAGGAGEVEDFAGEVEAVEEARFHALRVHLGQRHAAAGDDGFLIGRCRGCAIPDA